MHVLANNLYEAATQPFYTCYTKLTDATKKISQPMDKALLSLQRVGPVVRSAFAGGMLGAFANLSWQGVAIGGAYEIFESLTSQSSQQPSNSVASLVKNNFPSLIFIGTSWALRLAGQDNVTSVVSGIGLAYFLAPKKASKVSSIALSALFTTSTSTQSIPYCLVALGAIQLAKSVEKDQAKELLGGRVSTLVSGCGKCTAAYLSGYQILKASFSTSLISLNELRNKVKIKSFVCAALAGSASLLVERLLSIETPTLNWLTRSVLYFIRPNSFTGNGISTAFTIAMTWIFAQTVKECSQISSSIKEIALNNQVDPLKVKNLQREERFATRDRQVFFLIGAISSIYTYSVLGLTIDTTLLKISAFTTALAFQSGTYIYSRYYSK